MDQQIVTQPTKEYSWKSFLRDLWRYVRPYKKKFWIATFFRFTGDLFQLYPIWAFSQVVALLSQTGAVYSPEVGKRVTMLLVGWAVSAVYRGATHNFSKFLGFQVAEKASLDLLKDCVKRMFELDFSWQEKENSGNKLKRIDKGRDSVNDALRRFFVVFVETSVNTIGIVLLFSSIEKWLSVALIFFIISYFVIGSKLLKKAGQQERKVNALGEDLFGFIFECFNNIQTIKSLVLNHGVMQTVRQKVAEMMRNIKIRIFWYQFQGGVLNSYDFLFEVCVVSAIAWGVWHGAYNVSLLVLFIGLYQKVTSSTRELTDVAQDLIVARVGLSRAMDILNTQPEIESEAKMMQQQLYPENWQQLRIENLSFKYHKRDVLRGISLMVERGQKVGIVGLSGAGKSTLFKLLLDLYEDYDGQILVGDVPLKQMRRQTFIDHVSVVLQDTELFNMSLKENITLAGVAGRQISEAQFAEILETAHLNDVIANLPQGIETLVGEKGIKLSGGQRQRVGIARALYRQPDILLFDEATSHLDVHSEKQIQASLEKCFSQFTTIVIAHRLSTIRAMDKIVVLEKGHVIEEGSFEELLAVGGIFAKMWEAQKL